MQLKVDVLGIESGGKPIVFMNKSDADEIGVAVSGRVILNSNGRERTTIVNTSTTVKKGFIGINEEVKRSLELQQSDTIEVEIAPFPKSLQFIRSKLNGRKLSYDEIYEIVKGVVEGDLNESEIAAFVTVLHVQGFDLDEATSLSSAMVATGKQLQIDEKIIVDKHSIGGTPGDKTTLLVVPIVAAAGLTIPKTSSRAITSVAGTADKAETMMPVNLSIEEMQDVVKKCKGCIVWGGALELAPADDIFVKIEYPLCIDPLLLPSIMSKKKSVGATHLVVDIPTGRGAKVKTIGEADYLAKDIIELSKRLQIHAHCVLTYGEQPIGFGVGPALEAKEALEVLMNKKNVPDLVDKACHIAEAIFEMVGKKNGYELAKDILKTGKAEKKLREIISLQGGDSNLQPSDLIVGEHFLEVKSKDDGQVLWIDNNIVVEIARAAGSPKDKGAGILFNKKQGDKVSKNDVLFTIFAEKDRKLSRAEKILAEKNPVRVGKQMEMFIHRVEERPFVRKAFVLDR
jgi:AMP phosphorylase